MPEFSYSDLLPLGEDATRYQRLSSDGVTARSSFGRNFLEIEPQVLTGLTYKEIGGQLFISAKTVEHHMARIRRRLGAQSRRELFGQLQVMLTSDHARD